MTNIVLIPVYNDWQAAGAVLEAVARELSLRQRTASVLLVDDGSSETFDPNRLVPHGPGLEKIDILELRHNLGHQRAIAIGLAYLEARDASDVVVIMDGDGEDLPSDVNRLLDTLEKDPGQIVFAERRRRSEGTIFKLLYHLYRALHFALTGESVRVGNFSAIPKRLLRRLVAVSDLWNNYSAAVFHARMPVTLIPTNRGTRYAGRSKMNFVALVVHGLSAMSVYGDRIGVRLLFGATTITAAAVATSVGILLWELLGGMPVSLWTLGLAGLVLLVLLFVMLGSALGFVFIILASRGLRGFLPFRDYAAYVSQVTHVFPPST